MVTRAPTVSVAILAGCFWLANLTSVGSSEWGVAKANAASFDCSKATKSLEQLICTNPELSALDDKMAYAYQASMAKLDSDAAQILKDSQLAWLKFLRVFCSASDRDFGTTAECLDAEYTQRIRDLEKSLITQPAYTFLQVAEYQVIKNEADPTYDTSSETGRHYLSYPQIISPISDETMRWNEDAQKWARSVKDEWMEIDGNPLAYVSMTVKASLSNFVSAEKSVYWMGAAHLWGAYWNENVILSTQQEVTADQVFLPETNWREVLSARVFKNITLEPGRLELSQEFFNDDVGESRNWSISVDSLVIGVDPDTPDGRQYGLTEVEIPWRELKDYLRPDLPIALKLD